MIINYSKTKPSAIKGRCGYKRGQPVTKWEKTETILMNNTTLSHLYNG